MLARPKKYSIIVPKIVLDNDIDVIAMFSA